jgi:hypothetical protein
MSEKEKKKRGRKPKDILSSNLGESVPKKRGRKPKGKIINYKKNFEISSMNEEIDNIIMHLPIKLEDVLNDNTTDESPTPPIHDNIINLFTMSDSPDDNCVKCTDHMKKIDELNDIINNFSTSETNQNIKSRNVYKIDVDFINIEDNKQVLIESTDIHCWWCCHKFDNAPCPLPELYVDEKFYVFGCFCSFNCALAYNIDIDDYKTNERTTLLNMIHSDLCGNKEKLEASPPRQILKIFGGHLSIEKFRNYGDICEKEYRYIMPPMVSIVPLIEEDYKNKNHNYKSKKYIPLNTKKAFNTSDDLRLKRSKPLSDTKFSLEHTMGITNKK